MERLIWWCSFADDDGLRGVVIIPSEHAEDIEALARRLWMLGINPGGEMAAVQAPVDVILESGEEWQVFPANQGRLIGKEELERRGYMSITEVNPVGFDRDGFEADMDANRILPEGENHE